MDHGPFASEPIRRLVHGRRVAVVGVGNRLRGDDGVGSLLAERLATRGASPVLDAGTVPENYVGPLLAAGVDVVLFVDAADFGGTPGECCIAPASELAGRGAATHTASLALIEQWLQPGGVECWLLGIQPHRTGFAEGLSEPVGRAADAVEKILAAALEEDLPHA
jgi:hydrogenase 3 maturation protease